MNNVFEFELVPGLTALILFLVYTYLYGHSRQTYFRAWQIAWGAYCAHYTLLAFDFTRNVAALFLTERLLLAFAGICILVSTRLVDREFRTRWSDFVIALLGIALAGWNTSAHLGWNAGTRVKPVIEMESLAAVMFLYSGCRFYLQGRKLRSPGYGILSMGLMLWAATMLPWQFQDLFGASLFWPSPLLEPLPLLVVGISMVIVLYESDRRIVQDNSLAFSSLGLESQEPLSAAEMKQRIQQILHRMMNLAKAERGAICFSEAWAATLPDVWQGFSSSFVPHLQQKGIGEYLSELAFHQGGVAAIEKTATASASGTPPTERQTHVAAALERERLSSVSILSLHSRQRNLGCILLVLPDGVSIAPAQAAVLSELAAQLAVALENYLLVHDEQRRAKEYKLLTDIGKAVSSRLDPDEVLRSIHSELAQLFDTNTFCVAFLEGDNLDIEFRTVSGKIQPKHTRPCTNGILEYVIRRGEPLLIRHDLERTRTELGLTADNPEPKCYCAVPILMGGRSVGVMAALSYEREAAYDERDLESMQTAAGQVAVAMENARLFSQEQRRAECMEFLHRISKTAISSQDAEAMLDKIMDEIRKTFAFDHVSIGMLDYAAKEVEIKAASGEGEVLGRRLPLGSGIIGKVAKTNAMVLSQNGNGYLMGVLPDTRSLLCIPLSYSNSLLGVLNIESRKKNAFPEQEVLILHTLADLLATALHNAFVFQKLQQQSITDGLTGLKTRRFFLESLQAEWKRDSRSGRPFSILLLDLDHFKEVNDNVGHLQGDLVLARVGRLLDQNCRQSNIMARYGGDEFVVLMPEAGLEQAHVLAERLRQWLTTDPMLNEHHITGSIGLASYPVHGSTAQDLLRVADAGMYIAKRKGGNCVCTAEELVSLDSLSIQRQVLAAYVEGFLQRQETAPESVEELVSTLKKLASTLTSPEPLKEAILSLSKASEARELHTTGHGEFVSRRAEALARAAGLTEVEVRDVVFAARVHDVGKIVIPREIICKPAGVTPEERLLLRRHVEFSRDILSVIPDFQRVIDMVQYHHERFDGKGYPKGLRGEEIPIGARILTIADCYVTMTTERPFANGRTLSEGTQELRSQSGTHFDPALIELFVECLEEESAARARKGTPRILPASASKKRKRHVLSG